MIRKTVFAALGASSLIAQPVFAEDDPNAAIKAQTAAIEAETAKINAQAARDKATIDSLNLPKFDNKTSLENDGGAIETAMLATRAISAAAIKIREKVGCSVANPQERTFVVLAGNEALDLNAGKIMSARFDYFDKRFTALLPKSRAEWSTQVESLVTPGTVITAASAVAGLLGSETTVSGVKLPEIDDQMLANALAGGLKGCAVMPSAGAGIIADGDPLRAQLNAVIKQRNAAAAQVVMNGKSKASTTAALTAAVTDFDAYLKEISTTDANGRTPFVAASLAEKITLMPSPQILRVAVNRSGGTITNTKNIGTYFGADPIRVSGGLVATYVLVDAVSGTVQGGDTIACQTARVKLRDVQSGRWSGGENRSNDGKAFCKASDE